MNNDIHLSSTSLYVAASSVRNFAKRRVSCARKVSRFPAVLLSSVSPHAETAATAQIESRDYSPCVTPTFFPGPRLNPSEQTISAHRGTGHGERKISPYATRVDDYNARTHRASLETASERLVTFSSSNRERKYTCRKIENRYHSENFSSLCSKLWNWALI